MTIDDEDKVLDGLDDLKKKHEERINKIYQIRHNVRLSRKIWDINPGAYARHNGYGFGNDEEGDDTFFYDITENADKAFLDDPVVWKLITYGQTCMHYRFSGLDKELRKDLGQLEFSSKRALLSICRRWMHEDEYNDILQGTSFLCQIYEKNKGKLEEVKKKEEQEERERDRGYTDYTIET